MTRLTIAERRVLEAKAAYDSAPPGRKWLWLVRLRDARTAALRGARRRKVGGARAAGRGSR